MSPIRLILVRHGNTFERGQTAAQVGARTDLPLTHEGRDQARRFANYLAAKHIVPQTIYAGSLQRQIETATITTEYFPGSNWYLEPSLTEIDYGPWEGLTLDQINQRWPSEYRSWTTEAQWPSFFGGSLEAHCATIQEWLNTLRHTHAPGETIVGVTSNGIIRLFYSLQNDAWLNLIASKQIESLKVTTGHFCELLLFKDSLQITQWNMSTHLL